MAIDGLAGFPLVAQRGNVALQLGDRFVLAGNLLARDVAAFGDAAHLQAVSGADGAELVFQFRRDRRHVVADEAAEDLGREVRVLGAGGAAAAGRGDVEEASRDGRVGVRGEVGVGEEVGRS